MRRSLRFLPLLLVLAVLCPVASAELDVQTITLDNGLRVYVLEREASPTFAAIYLFGVGGTSDPKGRSGIAQGTGNADNIARARPGACQCRVKRQRPQHLHRHGQGAAGRITPDQRQVEGRHGLGQALAEAV